MFDGLEAADGPAELDPVLGVMQRAGEEMLSGSNNLGGLDHGGQCKGAVVQCDGDVTNGQHACRGDLHAFERDLPETSRQVKRRQPPNGQTGRRGRHE